MRSKSATKTLNNINKNKSEASASSKHTASTNAQKTAKALQNEGENRHQLMDGKVQLYLRKGSPNWQCACSIGGRQQRANTREDSLSRAAVFAREWYLALISADRPAPNVRSEKASKPAKPTTAPKAIAVSGPPVRTFREAARRFMIEFEAITQGQRNAIYVHGHRRRPPDEYKQLYAATRERAKNPTAERWRDASETLHDFVLFMVNTGLRPDEALGLEYRDVTVATDEATGQRILEIAVRGKRGVGWCKSMPGAVMPFGRLQARANGGPRDRLFPALPRQLFNTILEELDLKVDREGQRRTTYSLRHTYICMRLMEGADIYQVAKNCRTSVEMIETYYASHIKNRIDASAINVRKTRASPDRSANAAVRPGLSRARSKVSTAKT